MGFEYAITIDSDGQHYPEDIPLFIEAFLKHRGAFLVGVRDFGEENMPGKNNFANKFSNFWFYFQTGISLPDTQCGYRMYPLSMLDANWHVTSRYESELEFLVYSAWKGKKLVTVPIQVFYPEEGKRISSFRPFWDFLRITILNIVLTTGAVFYYQPARLIRKRGHRQ
jgi:glycosyltransferase involved in cell wall biosynthesis